MRSRGARGLTGTFGRIQKVLRRGSRASRAFTGAPAELRHFEIRCYVEDLAQSFRL